MPFHLDASEILSQAVHGYLDGHDNLEREGHKLRIKQILDDKQVVLAGRENIPFSELLKGIREKKIRVL